MGLNKISVKHTGNQCNFTCKLPDKIQNFKCVDIFVGDNDIIFACDFTIFRNSSSKKFDTKDIKDVQMNFNTESNEFNFSVPYLPEQSCIQNILDSNIVDENSGSNNYEGIEILKMTRITDKCKLFIDSVESEFEERFSYGFACQFKDDLSLQETTLKSICALSNPAKFSPLRRWFIRDMDEDNYFCKDQYKLNIVSLQIPSGFNNPMLYTFNFNNTELSSKQQYTLDNILSSKVTLNTKYSTIIECGLTDILLAICYDIRCTLDEPTCESAWTRTVLSPLLYYFQPSYCFESVCEAFIRRSLTYPLYRNYDFSKCCVDDAIKALQSGKRWIIKQFLNTYNLFLECEESRHLLNRYFIEDYLRYLYTEVTENQLLTLSRNLKNASLNISKKSVRLNLIGIESEFLRDLIDDVHLGESSDSDDIASDIDTDEEADNNCR